MANKKKIVFYDIDPWMKKQLEGNEELDSYEVVTTEEALDESTAELAKDASIVSVLIFSRLGEAELEKMEKVEFVCTRSTGFDHIDLEACKKRDIKVANVPHYGENTVAEHAFALILALSRKMKVAVRNSTQLKFDLSGLKGFDLKGKTIGVIGAGGIGLNVIRIAGGFGMECIAFDAKPQHLIAEVLGFEYVGLDELLARSHVISLHTPLNKATHHLLNKDNMKNIRPGAILVNTARGGVVDTDALVWALDEGVLAGAGLDVLEGEESIKEDAAQVAQYMGEDKLRAVVRSYSLLQRDNVIITPHSAFYSVESEERIYNTTMDNIQGFLSGSAVNIVSD